MSGQKCLRCERSWLDKGRCAQLSRTKQPQAISLLTAPAPVSAEAPAVPTFWQWNMASDDAKARHQACALPPSLAPRHLGRIGMIYTNVDIGARTLKFAGRLSTVPRSTSDLGGACQALKQGRRQNKSEWQLQTKTSS